MNNTDFQRLLTTNDKELIQELTKSKASKAKKGSQKFRSKGDGKGSGKAGSKGSGKGGSKGGKGEGIAAGPQGPQYRDRAKERRELKGEYERVAEEFENHGEVSTEESKYLGGDMDHTHLVKGLDYALLTKVRTEMTKQKKADELHELRAKKRGQKQQREFQTDLGRRIWSTVVDNLHVHHSTFKSRIEKMGQALALGQRMRGALSTFLPGRMCYEFDTAVDQTKTDIPRMVYISKEDAPSVDTSKKVAPILPDTISKVHDAFQRANEERKQRRREKAQGAEPAYVLTQKVVVQKHKAKDADNDIFQGAGGFDTTELAKKAAKTQVAPRASPSTGGSRPSYFDDAGSDKYRQAPEGQIELKDLEVEENNTGAPDGGEASSAAAAFEASEFFRGPQPGWVFKLGPLGLGYYMDSMRPGVAAPTKATKAGAAAAGAAATGAAASRRSQRAAAVPAADEEDAYGECFPSAGLGHALVQTGGGDSDEEAAEDSKKKRAQLGKKKDDGKGGDSLSANQKNAGDAKKRKMTEAQEWQKIDHMLKKGKHGSVEELEAYVSRPNRKQPPVPREIMSTPAFF